MNLRKLTGLLLAGTMIFSLAACGPEGKTFRVSIRDEGPGMTAEEQARIFQRFYSTSDEGAGLGLAIMKNIARRHDINVSLVSLPGHGTTITFTIPHAKAQVL